jgi:TorA maturation chaperone TorD
MEETLTHICRRADSYRFLSECYYLPDEELIQKVGDVAQTDLFFAELQDYIPPAVGLGSLRIDFTRLFVGPFKLLAPPYGSFYLENHRIMGESTVDIRNRYEEEALDVVIDDAPDHIAMELEFMYFLVAKQTQAINEEDLGGIQSYRKKQKSFLCSHLASWLPEFSKNVQQNAQTEFYKKVAQLTKMFVQKDLDAFASSVTQGRYSTGRG